MKTKQSYVAPAIRTYTLTAREHLLEGSLSATFISNPGIGDADDADEIDIE